MKPVHRLAAASLLADMALYLVMLSLPYRLLEMGASPLTLGLAPALYSTPYALTALVAGHLSDRWPRRTLIRLGASLAGLAALALSAVSLLPFILVLVSVLGVGLAFFWPSLQAAFSEIDRGHRLPHHVSLYNVSWSTGKGLGFLSGGLLLHAIGGSGVAVTAAGALLAATWILPPLPAPGDHSRAIEDERGLPGPEVRAAFRTAAWLANGMTFGLSATLNHQYPKLLLQHGIDARAFGLFLGAVFLAQTCTFLVLRRWIGWRYRADSLLGTQLLMIGAALLMPRIPSLPPLLFMAPLLGAGLGFCYHSSLYYSVHVPTARGRRAGIHESILHTAAASIPLMGGALAARGGNLDAPYWVAASALAASALAGVTALLRASRDDRYPV